MASIDLTPIPTTQTAYFPMKPAKPLSKVKTATYNTYHKKPYATGDGDVPSIRRPGSDQSHLKSWGDPC